MRLNRISAITDSRRDSSLAQQRNTRAIEGNTATCTHSIPEPRCFTIVQKGQQHLVQSPQKPLRYAQALPLFVCSGVTAHADLSPVMLLLINCMEMFPPSLSVALESFRTAAAAASAAAAAAESIREMDEKYQVSTVSVWGVFVLLYANIYRFDGMRKNATK
jgi:hypothetical protein